MFVKIDDQIISITYIQGQRKQKVECIIKCDLQNICDGPCLGLIYEILS